MALACDRKLLTMKDHYDENFFLYTSERSEITANRVAGFLRELFGINVNSIFDVGCADGTWLSAWRRHGIDRISGIDGYAKPKIPDVEYQKVDFEESSAISALKHADLIQFLEVIEHLSEEAGQILLRAICAKTNLILFSAATPGQGGLNHINERPFDYWKKIFEEEGFLCFDIIRPLLADNRKYPTWYRFNMLLYVREHSPHITVLESRGFQPLAKQESVCEVSPLSYKLRCHLVRMFPITLVNMLSRITSLLRS